MPEMLHSTCSKLQLKLGLSRSQLTPPLGQDHLRHLSAIEICIDTETDYLIHLQYSLPSTSLLLSISHYHQWHLALRFGRG